MNMNAAMNLRTMEKKIVTSSYTSLFLFKSGDRLKVFKKI